MSQTSADKHLQSAWKIIPHFPSSNIMATVKHYTENLHFTLGGIHPSPSSSNPPTMCSVAIGKKSDANIYLFQTPSPVHPSAAMIALGTRQLDAYYEILKAEGKVEISMPIEDMEWGYRQFEVKDGDGNRIQFFRFLEGGNPGIGKEGEGGDASELLWREQEGEM